jgi:hypothetical protein
MARPADAPAVLAEEGLPLKVAPWARHPTASSNT